MPDVTVRKPLLPAIAACALIIAGCALPQQGSTRPPAKATAHAVAPRTAPDPSFAAIVADIQNCAAGADFPGHARRVRIRDFAWCLGIDDVPAVVVPCAERQFRLREDQGAEAVALAVRAECGKTITERKNPR